MSLHTFSAHIGSPFRYLGKSSATRGSIIKADFRTQKNHAPICQESRFTNLALRKCESELHPADEWVESLKYKRAKDVNLTCNRSSLPYNMANAYKASRYIILGDISTILISMLSVDRGSCHHPERQQFERKILLRRYRRQQKIIG